MVNSLLSHSLREISRPCKRSHGITLCWIPAIWRYCEHRGLCNVSLTGAESGVSFVNKKEIGNRLKAKTGEKKSPSVIDKRHRCPISCLRMFFFRSLKRRALIWESEYRKWDRLLVKPNDIFLSYQIYRAEVILMHHVSYAYRCVSF